MKIGIIIGSIREGRVGAAVGQWVLEQSNARTGAMREDDHQFQQPLVVGVMERQGSPGVPFDVEGSGFGFRVVRQIEAAEAALPFSCTMRRFS